MGDSTQVELVKIFLDFCSHLRKNDLVSALRTITEISKLSTENFNVLKSLAQRVFLAKFMIFSHIFLCCYEETKSDVVSLATLSITAREDVITFIKDTVKSLMDSIKRKSTSFFTGSSKNKYQELLDEILHNIYPVYSVCRGYNQPYRVSKSNANTKCKLHVCHCRWWLMITSPGPVRGLTCRWTPGIFPALRRGVWCCRLVWPCWRTF